MSFNGHFIMETQCTFAGIFLKIQEETLTIASASMKVSENLSSLFHNYTSMKLLKLTQCWYNYHAEV
jgi:hypothetical protein